MKTLSKHWLTEPHLDFEYKKYVVLGWLQEVEKRFAASSLFPAWPDVQSEHRRLLALQQSGEQLWHAFPKELTGLDLKKQKLKYRAVHKTSKAITEVQEIMRFAIPQFEAAARAGARLRDHVQKTVSLLRVGVLPLYLQDGYLLVFAEPDVHIYGFQLRQVRMHREENAWRDIQLEFVNTLRRVRSLPPESIKRDLIARYPERPNPATFAFEAEAHWPLEDTLLPIAREALYARIAA